MIFRQFYLGCLAHASYLVGDDQTRTAVVVDPRRDVQQYLDEADMHGLQIRHVFLTHLHADFIAGHLELRKRVGATIHLGAKAQTEYPFTAMKNGDRLELGSVRLEVLETPGHTVESISIVVYDLQHDATRLPAVAPPLRGAKAGPYAVLTGDTLFIGDVGRPDLRASLGWSARDLGRLLHQSLHGRLLPLPDSTLVYPAHGAGSLCGKNISKDTVSTMGEQRRTNYALQPMTEDDFVALVTADQPGAPRYFTYDAILNAKERPTLETVLERELTPLTLARVLEMVKAGHAGAQILDVRDPGEFAQGHIISSINIGLNGQYATWAGTLLTRERPIVIVAVPGRETEAAIRLGRIGFDNVNGFLEGGMQALEARPDLLAYTEQTSAAQLAERLASLEPPLVLDVRTENEWTRHHIDGSLNVPLNRLEEQLSELPRQRAIVVQCAAGYRSSIAASLLQREGFRHLGELTGGLAAWEAARRPVQY